MPTSRVSSLLLVSLSLAACDSTGPGSGGTHVLRFAGRLQPADPTIQLMVSVFPEPDSTIYLGRRPVSFDSLGDFADSITGYPDATADSLALVAVQPTCDVWQSTRLVARGVAASGRVLRWPDLNLSAPGPVTLPIRGVEFCGMLAHDLADGGPTFVSMILDSIADSVFGRYSIDHSASYASDEGILLGRLTPDTLYLEFHTTADPQCDGAGLVAPRHPGGYLELAAFTGQPNPICGTTSGLMHLYPHNYGFPPLPAPAIR